MRRTTLDRRTRIYRDGTGWLLANYRRAGGVRTSRNSTLNGEGTSRVEQETRGTQQEKKSSQGDGCTSGTVYWNKAVVRVIEAAREVMALPCK